MSVYKKFHFLLAVISVRMLNKSIPLCVGIHVTSRCNFNCIYCCGGYAKKSTIEFSTSQILGLIDELKEMGTRWITLTGGEPLLRDDIGLLISKIKSAGIICSMNTNGSLVNQKIDVVKKLDFITVSLDGDEASNDKNRGKGSFKQIMQGIECLKANKIPFDVVSVLTKYNVHSIDVLLAMAKRLGFFLEFNFLQDQDSSCYDQSCFCLSDQEIKNVLKKLLEYKRKGYPLYYAEASRRYSLNWPVSYQKKILFEGISGFKAISCYMGSMMCHIDSDGKVYPCIQLAGSFPALNFLSAGFRKSWENLKNKKCKACYAVCYSEFNKFFNLDVGVWTNSIMTAIKSKITSR